MLPIISIVGRKDSGKTHVVEVLVSELTRRGLRITTIKHCEGGFQLDRAGTDSDRHTQAGAAAVALVAPDQFAILGQGEMSLLRLAAFLAAEADLVVAEGFGKQPFPKIEVVRKAVGEEPLFPAAQLMAFVSDVTKDLGAPKFGFDEIEKVADLVAARIVQPRRATTLIVDGKEILLNRFTDNFVASTVHGLTTALRDVPDAPQEIYLRIKQNPPSA